jgi:hypothetical protein
LFRPLDLLPCGALLDWLDYTTDRLKTWKLLPDNFARFFDGGFCFFCLVSQRRIHYETSMDRPRRYPSNAVRQNAYRRRPPGLGANAFLYQSTRHQSPLPKNG